MADTRIWKWLLDWARSLNLFPDYFQALRENFLNVIFGPSVLAVIYGIWSLIAVPPLSITLLFLGGAALLASYYVWRADHLQLVSKITLRFENREPFKQTTPMEDVLGVRFYFRVFPHCSIPVPNCTGYLLAVFKEVDGRWEPTQFNEAVALTWANGSAGPITVEPGIGPYLNIFCVDSVEKEIIPCVATPTLRTSATFREDVERATFRFDIKMTNGAPISLKVKMDEVASHWDRPSVELLSKDENNSN